MNKQRIILSTILGLGGVALVVDRLNSTRASADAAENYAVTPDASPVAVATSAKKQITIKPLGGLAQRMRDEAARTGLDVPSVRDAFALEKSPAAQIAAAKPVFAANHKLTATMTNRSGGAAIVDGKLLRVGQTIDGARLTAVTQKSATFDLAGQPIDLRLAETVR